MKLLRLILAPLCLIATASAQDVPPTTDTLPPPPWLNRAPDMSHWIITYDGGSPSGSSETHSGPKAIEVIKSGKTMLEQTTNQDGSVSVVWRKDGYAFIKSPGGNQWTLQLVGDARDPFNKPDYTHTDFAGFDWIAEKNFVGINLVKGDKCLVFRDKVFPLSDVELNTLQLVATFNRDKGPFDLNAHMVDAEADIDLKTLLPISLKVGNSTRVFTYQAPPETSLDLPQDAQDAFTNYLKSLAPQQKN